MKYTGNFIGRRIIITEKIDGENSCFKADIGQIFARSHSTPNFHPSSNYIKRLFEQKYYVNLLNPDYWYFGENTFGIHSIEYNDMGTYFYLFNIYDIKRQIWLSWDDLVEEANRIGIAHAPVIFDGEIKSLLEIKTMLEDMVKYNNKSLLGGECEGGVTRIADSFTTDEFKQVVAKYVRKGHVQTDEHWKLNWKQAPLSDKGYGWEFKL